MTQERMQPEQEKNTTVSNLPQAPDITSTLARVHKATDKVRVIHGSNEQYFDNLLGKTVGSVRKSLREVFNIPGDAHATVDGKQVNDDFVLAAGQNLEFSKELGDKGVSLYIIRTYDNLR